MPYETNAATINETPTVLLVASPMLGAATRIAPTTPTNSPVMMGRDGNRRATMLATAVAKRGRRAVEHPGQRRRYMLFRVRKHAQRKREPEDAKPGGARPIAAIDRTPRRGHERQHREPDSNPHERYAVRRERRQTYESQK